MTPDGSKLTARIPLSPGVRALNPALFSAQPPITPDAVSQNRDTKGKPRGRAPMNKTETRFADILEARLRRGDIKRWQREGITLRWPDGMTYSGDFYIRHNDDSIEIAETKGAHIREDAIVKFRAARAFWPEFKFSMHQWARGNWTQIL